MTAEHGPDSIDGPAIASSPWVWLVDDDQELQEMLGPTWSSRERVSPVCPAQRIARSCCNASSPMCWSSM